MREFTVKLGKLTLAIFSKPTVYFFFLTDRFYNKLLLPLLSNIWWLEWMLRGGIVGRGMFLGRPVLNFFPGSKVTLKDGFSLISDQRRSSTGNLYAPCKIYALSATSSVYIGEGTGLAGTSIVSRSHSIHIGKQVMIAPNCIIMDSPWHAVWPPEQRQPYTGTGLDKDIWIGDNCWIALGCLILPGSRIGDNSVIGARSVVIGEIPSNSLAIGNPAKVIRKLD